MMYDFNHSAFEDLAPDEDVESQLLTTRSRRVRFQEQNDVRLIPSFDESLKGDLFYSRADYAMFLAYFEVFQFEEYAKERNARVVTRAIRLLFIVLMIWFAARQLIWHEVV